ncbi:non-ribosomal peptide synthetase [Pseudoalteromonas sp. Of7M-16]|uniref:non-ribosomal peptide synthetase n=1 Tax=Pseudoalteromonas sp. Of7M-16 TaxID=2917756 RepID=UPI001EF54247|nr:non-ribosomal peptide synthetase [Pseudoalteromonas sp. Of7M-16]MCG7548608.1 amino acid adenylation domain-containing protein [Pseudoalteromonas sp. Of7M-16]
MKDLFIKLAKEGVEVYLQDGKLKARAHKGGLKPELLNLIKENKAQLLAYLNEAQSQKVSVEHSSIAQFCAENTSEPISFQQQRIWFIDQFEGSSSQYNLPLSAKIKGCFDLDIAQQSFEILLQRHQSLRTNYHEVENETQVSVQPQYSFNVTEVDLSHLNADEQQTELEQFTKTFHAREFDLSNDVLIDCAYVKQQSDLGVLLVVVHHIASDGWSMQVLVKEFIETYQALSAGQQPDLPELTISYSNYANWQRNWLQPNVISNSESFWLENLSEAPSLHSLPLDKPRPVNQSYNTSVCVSELPSALLASLKQLAAKENCTLFMLVHAALSLVLMRYGRLNDLVIGTPVANRNQAELANMVGFFTNTVLLKSTQPTSGTFQDYLKEVREVNLLAQENQDVPFERIVEIVNPQRSTAYAPLFQIELNMNNTGAHSSRFEFAGLELEVLKDLDLRTPLDLMVSANELDDALEVKFIYSSDLFDAATINQLSNSLAHVLATVADDIGVDLTELSLLDDTQQSLALPDFTTTPSAGYFHQLVEQAANSNPDAIAIQSEAGTITYAELNAKANQLARSMQDKGLVREDRVAICLNRSIEFAISMLAVAKSGGAFVPVDISMPEERIAYILQDTAATIVLTEQEIMAELPLEGQKTILVDPMWFERFCGALSSENLESQGDGCQHNLSYVIYTSGSTGEPKGVAIEHGALANFIDNQTDILAFDQNSVVLNVLSFSFDAGIGLLCSALSSGATTVIAQADEPFYALIDQHHISHISVTSLMLKTIPEQNYPSLQSLVIGGDKVPSKMLEFWLTQCRVINEYGPTEAAVTVLSNECSLEEPINIGTPYKNVQTLVLDDNLNLVPAGGIGELYLAGAQLAREYLNQPKLTQRAFIANPYTADTNARLYKTGDLVRALPSGKLEFVGRVDEQVKVRGYRIELSEIEHQISLVDGVVSNIVIVAQDDVGNKRIIAYVESTHADERSLARLLGEKLQTALPDYMIPAAFIKVAQWPKTLSGKIDRNALPEPSFASQDDEIVHAENELERQLVAIWAEYLKLDEAQVSVTANFFELGGDSILSIQIASKAAQQGLHFRVKDIFAAKTIRALTEYVSCTDAQTHDQAPSAGQMQLMPIHSEFFADETQWHHYNQSLLLNVSSKLAQCPFGDFVQLLVERHDALRLCFEKSESGWQAEFLPLERLDLNAAFQLVDLNAHPEISIETYANDIQKTLNPAKGELFKLVYFHDADKGQGKLLWVVHHLVVDGVSWRILTEDLNTLVQQWEQKQTLALNAKTTSYQQWAESLHELASSEHYQNQLEYWQQQASVAVPNFANGDINTQNAGTHGSRETAQFTLSDNDTALLLNKCNASYRTQINELLFAALSLASNRWRDVSAIRFDLEGHGRDELDEAMDISQTVGWFTTFYPLTIHAQSSDIAETISAVKNAYRSVPDKGLGFGLLKHCTGQNDVASFSKSELSFNYLGQIDASSEQQGLMSLASESTGENISLARKAEHLMALNGMVQNNQLKFNLSYDSNTYHASEMSEFMAAFNGALVDIITHCADVKHGRYCESDFPLASVNEAQINEWAANAQIADLYPATGMQQGLLFQSTREQGSYVTQTLLTVESIEIESFISAWQMVVARNPIFRTEFRGIEAGHCHQVVRKEATLPWVLHDLSALSIEQQEARLEQLIEEDKQAGFDFNNAPVMRLTLCTLADGKIKVLWSHHHALLDGWCLTLVFDEVTQYYRQITQGVEVTLDEPVSYRNYIEWLSAQDLEQAREKWQVRLADFTKATPTPLYKSEELSNNERVSSALCFDSDTTARLQKLAQVGHTTINTLLQAAWAYALSIYSNDENVCFGTVVSGRPATIDNVDSIMGLFINTIPVQVTVAPEKALQQWLSEIHQELVESSEMSFIPLAEIQKLVADQQSLFDSLLVFENYPVDEQISNKSAEAGINVTDLVHFEKTNFAIQLTASVTDSLEVRFELDNRHYVQSDAQQLADSLSNIIMSMLNEQTQFVKQLDVIGDSEKLLESLVAKGFEDSQQTLHEVFELQAARYPNKTAVEDGKTSLTYSELNQKANQMAHILLEQHQVTPDSLVGVCLQRSCDMAVTVLAILKAGGAYLPLDASYPVERIEYILGDAQPVVIITDETTVDFSALSQQTLLNLHSDDFVHSFAMQSTCSPEISKHTGLYDKLAYVIYTSGSTGNPKGVQVEHRNALSLFSATTDLFGFSEDEVWVMFHSLSFDFSVWEIWGALLHGGKLVVVPFEVSRAPREFYSLLVEHQVTVLNQTPSAFNNLIKECMDCPAHALRYVIFGGEALTFSSLRPWVNKYGLDKTQLVNMYGITETSVHVTYYSITHDDVFNDHSSSKIGALLPHLSAVVLDQHGNPSPVGAIGELHIGGSGVTRGYLLNPQLTSERFIANPFQPHATQPMVEVLYKTGDLVKQLDNGEFEYIGRNDHQVQVNGFRIELEEVEQKITRCEEVKSAWVSVVDNAKGQGSIVAYIVLEQSALSDSEAIDAVRAKLANTLPYFMLPTAFIPMEQWPLTVNGKLDTSRLPKWHGERAHNEYVAPQNEVEAKLQSLWCQLLKLSPNELSVKRNFFELGGDSIIAIQLVSKATEAGLYFTINDLFATPTVRGLADKAYSSSALIADQGDIEGTIELLPIQQEFFENDNGINHYNQAVLLEPPVDLTLADLQHIVARLYQTHDAMRLHFEQQADSSWVATHQEVSQAHIESGIAKIALNGGDWESILPQIDAIQASLDIATGELFKAVLITDENRAYRLLLVLHHLVVDGVSWRIIMSDIERIYSQLRNNSDDTPRVKTASFKQWGEYLSEYATSELSAQEGAYWASVTEQEVSSIANKQALTEFESASTMAESAIAIDSKVTNQILTSAIESFDSSINALLLSALLESISRTFDIGSIRIDMEGHGREALNSNLDLSGTIGWFTSVYPVNFAVGQNQDIAQLIDSVGTQLSKVPNNGIGYGALKYLAELPALQGSVHSELAFNYLGQFDQVSGGDGAFTFAPESVGQVVCPTRGSSHPLSANGYVLNGELNISIGYDTSLYCGDQIAQLANTFDSVLSEIAALSEQRLNQNNINGERIVQRYPATGMQTSLLIQNLFDKESYITQNKIKFKDLNVELFQKAWQSVMDKHAILRTSFSGIEEGYVVQCVHERAELNWHQHDLSEVEASQQLEAVERIRCNDRKLGMDPSIAPLMRMNLADLGEGESYLIWSHHHALLDGWSLELVFADVFQCYHALLMGQQPSTDGAVPYKNYIDWLAQQDLKSAKAFWKNELQERTFVGHFSDKNTQLNSSEPKIWQRNFALPKNVTQRIQEFARSAHVSVNAVVQGAWALVLANTFASDDVIFGVTTSGRPAQLPGVDKTVGLFINTLPVVVNVAKSESLTDWVKNVHHRFSQINQHSFLSFNEILQTGNLAGPIFDSLLVFENYPLEQGIRDQQSQLTLNVLEMDSDDETTFPLTVKAFVKDEMVFRLEGHSDTFTERQMDMLEQCLSNVLADIPQQDTEQVGQLPLFGERDLQETHSQPMASQKYSHDLVNLHNQFEQQAHLHPEKEAVVFEGTSLTYRQLNEAANQLSHYLINEIGVEQGDLVGICLPHSPDYIVAIIAMFKAGAAYIPMDPEYPMERLEYFLSDAKPKLVLADASVNMATMAEHSPLVSLSEPDLQAALAVQSKANPGINVCAQELAYVTYTSGSTGKPKGVMVEQGNLSQTFANYQEHFTLDADDVWSLSHSFSFDVSVWELWGALTRGAKIVVVPYWTARSPQALYDVLLEQQVTMLCQTPTAFGHLVDVQLEKDTSLNLKYVVFSGEALKFADLQPWVERYGTAKPALLNGYGVTETTIYSMFYQVTMKDIYQPSVNSKIGVPIKGVEFLVLNDQGEKVAAGDEGELYIAGAGVSRGYLHKEALTKDRFVHLNFGDEQSTLYYKTGDLVKCLADGGYEYIGRNDHQVNIKGFRVELGEIEHKLLSIDFVDKAYVTPSNEHTIAAFVVLNSTELNNHDELEQVRKSLAVSLPYYMQPDSIVAVESWPRTNVGKIDREALLAFSELSASAASKEPEKITGPETETERFLAQHWAALFEVELNLVDIHASFYQNAGNSLMMVRLTNEVKKAYSVNISVNVLYEYSTIHQLASYIDLLVHKGKDNTAQQSGDREMFEL